MLGNDATPSTSKEDYREEVQSVSQRATIPLILVGSHRPNSTKAPRLTELLIRSLTVNDVAAALAVINTAARWCSEFLPPAEFRDPEMTSADWNAESLRMKWFGANLDGRLTGVIGLEYVRDVALVRHAYVLPEHQRQGVGSHLLDHVEREVQGVPRILAGTYAGNYKARHVLEKAGYHLHVDSEAMLRAYYRISEDRLRSSVVYAKLLNAT